MNFSTDPEDHALDEGAALDQAPTTQPLRARRLVRVGAVAVACLAGVAAPAMAIVAPWEPTAGRPGIDAPVQLSRGPASTVAQQTFSVLRRTQTSEDRRVGGQLLSPVSTEIDGVKADAIRALSPRWALVPATRVQMRPGEPPSSAVCVTNGELVACTPDRSLKRSGVIVTTADTKVGTRIAGVVPDGVAAIRFTETDGVPTTVPVKSNFFELSIDELAPQRLIPAPAGYDGPAMIPGPTLPVAGQLQWLDAAGQRVGPNTP